MTPLDSFFQFSFLKATPRHRPLAATLLLTLMALISAAVLSACGGGDAADPGKGSGAQSVLQRAADGAVAAGDAGAVFGHVTIDALDLAAAGRRRVDAGDPVRATDVFHIGSTTKAMTAAVAAIAVERGEIAWTTTLAEALPDLAAGMRPEYRTVTLEQLLDHRGGVVAFRENADVQRFLSFVETLPDPLPDTAAGRQRCFAAWLLAQAPSPGVVPGRDYQYSNAGYALVAMMLEARTGRTFPALFEERLSGPLDMGVRWITGDRRTAGAPVGHVGAKGALAVVPPQDAGEAAWMAILAPGGLGLTITPQGYANWLRAHLRALQGTRTVLPDGYLQRLRTVAVGDYALGWVGGDDAGRALLLHDGADGGFTSLVVLDARGRGASFGIANTQADDGLWVVEDLARHLKDIEAGYAGR